MFRHCLLNLNDNTGVGVAQGCWAQSRKSLLTAPCEPFIRSYVKTVLSTRAWVFHDQDEGKAEIISAQNEKISVFFSLLIKKALLPSILFL